MYMYVIVSLFICPSGVFRRSRASCCTILLNSITTFACRHKRGQSVVRLPLSNGELVKIRPGHWLNTWFNIRLTGFRSRFNLHRLCRSWHGARRNTSGFVPCRSRRHSTRNRSCCALRHQLTRPSDSSICPTNQWCARSRPDLQCCGYTITISELSFRSGRALSNQIPWNTYGFAAGHTVY